MIITPCMNLYGGKIDVANYIKFNNEKVKRMMSWQSHSTYVHLDLFL